MVALTALVYLPTLGFDFIYDDHRIIEQNPLIRDLGHIPRFFVTDLWTTVPPFKRGSYYRPVWQIWATLSFTLHGLRPAAWHANVVIVHLLVTALLFPVARRITGRADAAIVAALLFGLHPVHGEVVAWIAGANASLSAVPFLIALLLGWRSFERDGSARLRALGGSVLAFVVALLTKEDAIALPGVLALTTLAIPWPGRERPSLREIALTLMPYLVAILIYLPVRVLALGSLSRTASELPLPTLLCALPRAVLGLLALLVAPVNLALEYPRWPRPDTGLADLPLPLVILGIIAIGLGLLVRRDRRVGAALAFLLPLTPLLDLRRLPRGELWHDRLLYLPSIGFVILLALLVERGLRDSRTRTLTRLGVVLTAMLYAGLTVRETAAFRDDLSLFRKAHRVAPQKPDVLVQLIAAHLARGGPGDLAAAEALNDKLRAANPGHWRTHAFQALFESLRGDFRAARDEAQLSLELGARRPTPLRVLIVRAELALERPTEALRQVRILRRTVPDLAELDALQGDVMRALGDAEAARHHYLRQLQRVPGHPGARAGLRALPETPADDAR